MSDGADPTVVRSIAVHASDVVAALEASRRGGRETVLRVTPPFSGRMRARLHASDAGTGESRPIHVDPESLVAASAPPYPTAAETEDALRADPDETYTVERHRERHEAAVAAWRASIADHVVDTVTLDTPAGPHEVSVTVLG